MTEEIWKPIPGFDNYEISNTGKVRSYLRRGTRVPRKTPVLLSLNKRGKYLFVSPTQDGERFLVSVHQIVMLAFVGECPEGLEVCHNDGDSTNNNLDNLRYDTHRSNINDIFLHGKRKFNKQDVDFIREEVSNSHQRSKTIKELAKKYDSNYNTIYGIAVGKSYQAVGGSCKKIDRNQRAKNIIRLHNNTSMTSDEIAQKFGITTAHLNFIVNGTKGRKR